jgi:hypothetical protein
MNRMLHSVQHDRIQHCLLFTDDCLLNFLSDMSDFNKISESLRIPLYNQKLIELSGHDRRETEGKTLQFLCYSIAEPLR